MNDQQDLIAEEIELTVIKRNKLIPIWIKVFAWIFLVAGCLTPIVFAIGIFGGTATLSLYGFETQEPSSFIGIIIIALFMLKGIVAFGLLKEKDWAVRLGLFDAITGIAVCTFTMLYPILAGEGGFTLRLELVAIIPFLLKLNNIRSQWETNSSK